MESAENMLESLVVEESKLVHMSMLVLAAAFPRNSLAHVLSFGKVLVKLVAESS